MEQTKNPVGRPKGSMKWSIDGRYVEAKVYYAWKRQQKRLSSQKADLKPIVNNRLAVLIDLRNKIEQLIQVEMGA